MRLECVEAFADATVRVLVATLGDEFGRGALRLARAEERPGGVTVHVRFRGEIDGYVALNIDEPTALRLYNRATDEQNAHLPRIGLDYFMELGNLISAGAVSSLNELGFDVTVHPPQLLADVVGADAVEVESCQIPVYSPHGGILVQVVLNPR